MAGSLSGLLIEPFINQDRSSMHLNHHQKNTFSLPDDRPLTCTHVLQAAPLLISGTNFIIFRKVSRRWMPPYPSLEQDLATIAA